MSNKKQGHPKGLYLLFVTEMWERFSYFGMRALFVLYMTKALLLSDKEASGIYGSYTGLVYLTPLLGGYIADRYWGNRRSITTGCLLMAAGQFLMFFSASCFDSSILVDIFGERGFAKWLMYCGLGLLILGNGFFKPNISTMVGDLYEPTDKRKDSAFTIFYMGINIGATIAPLWCGFVGDTDDPSDFKWGFLSAAIGMLIGLIVFKLLENKYLRTPDGRQIGLKPEIDNVHHDHSPEAEAAAAAAPRNSPLQIAGTAVGVLILFFLFSINYSSFGNPQIGLFEDADWIGSLIYSVCIAMPIFIASDRSLTKLERTRIYVIYIVTFFVIFFWAAYEQAGSSLTLFADRNIDRHIFGWEMPASYFQSVNAIFVVIFAPIMASLWSFLNTRKKEPSSPMKQAIGLLILSLSYLFISIGVQGIDSSTKICMFWLIGLYFLHTIGELCLSPIGLSLVNKLAPARFASLLMGVWYLSTAASNKLAGLLAGLLPVDSAGNTVVKSFLGYEIANLHDFFLLFCFMSAIAGVLMLCCVKQMVKMMHGIR
ncbi:MAG: peptide MFS transporter [Bacteroidaceae bacterium]|jgi:POT family proton-dependent oligopeptide transporter